MRFLYLPVDLPPNKSAMKRAIKRTLHAVGLLNFGERVYFNLKSASPSVLWREVQVRGNTGEDGFPLPPPNLMYDVIASRWQAVFLDSGQKVVDDMAAQLAAHGRPMRTFSSVLDFGCGCGRLIRHVKAHTDARLTGSDYNASLVSWCQDNLPFAQFSVNQLQPPFTFTPASFDFIYARSVFTHLPADTQQAWIAELYRVMQPGGVLYLTMHGDRVAGGLNPVQRAAMEKGELVTLYSARAGENLCTTYANKAYVAEQLCHEFDLLGFIPGRDEDHLRQDIYLLQKA